MTEETLPPEIDEWFVAHEYDDESTHAICEPYHEEEVHSFLLEGTERTVLIDTGLGIGDLKGKVEELTDVDPHEVVVVTSHVDWDHLGAHQEFGEVWVHEGQTEETELSIDVDLTASIAAGPDVEVEPEVTLRAVEGGERWLVDGIPEGRQIQHFETKSYRCTDEKDWFDEKEEREEEEGTPKWFDRDDYGIYTGDPDRTFEDGEELDLGDRTLEVLHTPGHAPGHCCFLDRENGYLFTGDLVYPGPIYVHEGLPGTDPRDFRTSIARIRDVCEREDVEWLLPSHQGTVNVGPGLVTRIERTLAEHPDRATGSLEVEWEPDEDEVRVIDVPCESDEEESSSGEDDGSSAENDAGRDDADGDDDSDETDGWDVAVEFEYLEDDEEGPDELPEKTDEDGPDE